MFLQSGLDAWSNLQAKGLGCCIRGQLRDRDKWRREGRRGKEQPKASRKESRKKPKHVAKLADNRSRVKRSSSAFERYCVESALDASFCAVSRRLRIFSLPGWSLSASS